jgi:signal peptidase II
MSDSPEPTTSTVREPDPASGTPIVHNKWPVFLIVAALSLIADQATKIWARSSLPVVRSHGDAACLVPEDIVNRACVGHPVSVIDGVWEWRLSMNPGSAFGLFSSQTGARIGLSIVGVVAVFGMLWMLRKARPEQKILHWALALVTGGAIGNLVDRIYFGVVTDFILWRYQTHEWPVFNVADVVLVVGVGLMFIDIQKEGRREKALKPTRQARAKAAGLVKDFGDK